MTSVNNQTKITADPVQHLPDITHFEDALTLTEFGKFNYLLILVSGTISLMNIFVTMSLSMVLPLAQCDLNLTMEDKGILGSIAFLGIISSSHMWGLIADTLGRRRAMIVSLIFSYFFSFISSFATGFWFFLSFRFLTGFFTSGSSATIYAYLSEFHNSKNQAKAIFGATVVSCVGCLVYPMVSYTIVTEEWFINIPVLSIRIKPWGMIMVFCEIPSLLCAIVLFILPESPKYVLLDGDQEKAISIIKHVHRINLGTKAKELNITAMVDENSGVLQGRSDLFSITFFLKLVWNQTAPLFNKKYLKATLLMCAIQFGICLLSEGAMLWVSDISNQVAQYTNKFPNESIGICDILTKTESIDYESTLNLTIANECSDTLDISAFVYMGIINAIYFVLVIVTGFVVSSFGKLPITLIVLLTSASSGILILFVPSSFGMVLFLVFVQCSLVAPIINLTAVEIYPTNMRAMAVCISLLIGRFGSGFGSNFVGNLLKYSCSGTFLVLGIDLIVCAILSVCFIPNIRTKQISTIKS